MKKLLLLSTLIAAIILIGSNITISKVNQPPTGKTGAPGEGSCTECHGSMLGSGNGISVDFNNPSMTFYNDSTYLIEFSVEDVSANRFGFELTALDTSGNKAGDFTLLTTSNTSLQNSANRQYVGHMSASTLNVWSFEWKAPTSGSGVSAVNFYANAIAANGTGTTGGDVYYDWNTTHGIMNGVGVQELEYMSSASVFSENQQINIQFQSSKSVDSKVEVYNMNGQKLFSQAHIIDQGFNDFRIDLSHLNQGLYIVKLYGADFMISRKVVLQ